MVLKGVDVVLEIILFSFGIMYTPGPLNILSLNQGANNKFRSMIGFFAGVGVAMMVLLIVIGYTGERIVRKEYLIYISCVGAAYILYLAYKIFKSSVDFNNQASMNTLSFKEGFFMQLFNPKGPIAVLPLATISFPANGITGTRIALMSVFLGLLAGMAPCSYGFLGERFSRFMMSKTVMKLFNRLMAALLIYVAFTILRDHVYLVLIGVNSY